ncbi:MAG: adenylate/guanylate cyclase domain-containing protein [Acidobacteria bacterium]|nr:MAG: adenylate/guanylate cyclase domain-containing protein [Acidobacteriota bacterium]
MLDRTFLFTDIEGSTTLWERFPERMRGALAHHDSLLRTAIEGHGGDVFKTVGDSFCAVFPNSVDAVRAAAAGQHQIGAEAWEGIDEPIRVRMAIHTGPAEARDGDYFGPTLNRVARILAAGHGGQILLSKAATDLFRDHLASTADLIDLGEHRLKDLVRPEHIFQYGEPGLCKEFPLLRSLSAFAHNLPEQLTSFIGRETELAEIKQLLSRTRLLTLSGSGGSGKTRLALQTAAESVDRFTNGVWFVDMAPVLDPDLLPSALATGLRLREQFGQTISETLVAFLQNKRMLLILDNCEQVVSACAELAEKLLRNCPGLHILATSREGLGIAGEITWRVPSLPIPSTQDLKSFEKVAQSSSVRLFVDRAASVLPDFRLTPKNAPAIVRVCQRLDGIPLAIELAAARVKTISPEEIALRLSDRFRLLTGGSRTALPRHQTLRAAIEWSYHLLGGLEGILFRRLSVFYGSFSLEASEPICGDDELPVPDVFDSVCRLVDKSLLIMEQSEGVVRYRMLETIREYASERLRESNETAVMQSRFMDFFLTLSRRAEREISGPAQGEWLERLDADHENFRAALAWNASEPKLAVAQLHLALALSRFWLVRGYWEEALTFLLRVISPEVVLPLAAERSRVFNSCGNFACQLGRYEAASQHYERSLAIRRELGDERGVAATLNNLGLVERHQGNNEQARPLFQEALELFRKLGEQRAAATCLNNLASTQSAEGRYAEADHNAREAMQIFKTIGDRLGIAASLSELGSQAMLQGHTGAAQTLFEESLALSRGLGEKVGIFDCLQHLGQLLVSQKDYESARLLYTESLDIARDLASAPYMAAAKDALDRLSRAPELDRPEGEGMTALGRLRTSGI